MDFEANFPCMEVDFTQGDCTTRQLLGAQIWPPFVHKADDSMETQIVSVVAAMEVTSTAASYLAGNKILPTPSNGGGICTMETLTHPLKNNGDMKHFVGQ